MAMVELDYNELCDLIGKRVEKERITERLSMMGAAVEDVQGDKIFVEVLPNRPDWLSVEGIARGLRSFLGIEPGLKEYKALEPKIEVKVDKSVEKVRPYIACAAVRGIKIDDRLIRSMMQIQEKLHETFGRKRKKLAIGIHDLSKVRPPFTYKAVKPTEISFVPLGMNIPMNLKEILERHPKGMDYAWTLEGAEVYPVIVDKNGDVLSFPPIINGELTRVYEETTDLFIDMTGSNEKTLHEALNILVCMFADRGAKIEKVKVGNKVLPDLSVSEKEVDFGNVEKLVGIKVDQAEGKKLLERMGYGLSGKKVKVPCYRTDIFHEDDIIEDIAIAYGYENLKPRHTIFPTMGGKHPEEAKADEIREILIGFGLQEVMTFMLTNEEKHYHNLSMEEGKRVEVANPKTKETTMVRTSLLPGLLEVLSNNKHEKYPQNLFEVGDVLVLDEKEETKVKSVKKVCGVCANATANYTDAKSIVEGIFRELGKKLEFKEKALPFMIKGRSAEFAHGYIGEVSPEVLSRFEINVPVSCFEFELI
jgi:phenylalanyl-tRNA synthetase beta chain